MAWDKNSPAPGIKAKVLDDLIRTNNDALETAIDNEHDFTTSGTQTGDHAQGSARCFFTDTAPATRVDGSSFIVTDNGSLWIKTDDNAFYLMTDYDEVVAADKWTPVSTEIIATLLASNRIFSGTLGVTGDFDVNTDKFNVESTSGNVAVAGTMTAVGVTILADGSTATTQVADDNSTKVATTEYVNNIGQSSQVVSTTDTSNSTGAFADLAGMTDTITTKGGNVLVMYSGPIQTSGSSDDAQFRVNIDGSPFGGWTEHNIGANVRTISFQWLATSLTAASHIFKIEWRDATGTILSNASSLSATRVLTLTEVPV